MSNTLKVGVKVMWSGAWGRQAPVETVVTAIEKDCEGKQGTEVDFVDWNNCEDDSVIVTLDNGHWAYGYQIKRTLGIWLSN